MLVTPMRDSEELRPPEEQLEELDVLKHLDARDVVSEAIRVGDESFFLNEREYSPWVRLTFKAAVNVKMTGIVLEVEAERKSA